MARYGKEYKDRVVARLLPPESATVESVPPRQNTCRLDRARLLLTFGS